MRLSDDPNFKQYAKCLSDRDLKGAIKQLRLVLLRAQALSDVANAAFLLQVIARTFTDQGKFATARGYYQKSEKMDPNYLLGRLNHIKFLAEVIADDAAAKRKASAALSYIDAVEATTPGCIEGAAFYRTKIEEYLKTLK